jgi:hypothetical protein
MEENKKNNANIQSTPQVESVVKNVPRKMNVLLITNIFLTLLIIGLGVYIFMTDKKVKQLEKGIQKKENITQKDTDENKIVEKEKTTETEYKGEYISAKLPKGWEIKEYTGGDAITTAEKSVQYSGLTNLIISKDKENLFEMKIIDGIGLLGCPEYVKFKDFPPAKIQEIEKENKEIGMTTEYIDYTNISYSEFTFLGSKVRRVKNRLFSDMDDVEQYFDPGCLEVIYLEDIFATASSNSNQTTPYKINIYQVTILGNSTENTLKELDKVLESIQPV